MKVSIRKSIIDVRCCECRKILRADKDVRAAIVASTGSMILCAGCYNKLKDKMIGDGMKC